MGDIPARFEGEAHTARRRESDYAGKRTIVRSLASLLLVTACSAGPAPAPSPAPANVPEAVATSLGPPRP
jgi:hypothetical protein